MRDFYKLLIVLLMVGISGFGYAQSKAGTTIGQFLKIEPSARNSAIGGASVSLSGEVMSAYYNPASLGRVNGIGAQFTHSQWLADIDYNYFTVALPIARFGTFAMQITSLNSGEIDVRTVDQPLGTGERYSVTNFSLGAGYGMMLTDRVSVGFQVNYLQETIWHSSTSGISLNMGVQYRVWENGPTFGASIVNFGPRTGYDGRDLFIDYDFNPDIYGDNDQLPAELRTDNFSLPTAFRAGISYPFNFSENNRMLLVVDAMHPNDNNESVNVGAEYQAFDYLFLRGGFRHLFLDDNEGGLTLGGGLNVGFSGYNITFDYAWADYGLLNETQRFTMGFQF